jgi:hypothetical protein
MARDMLLEGGKKSFEHCKTAWNRISVLVWDPFTAVGGAEVILALEFDNGKRATCAVWNRSWSLQATALLYPVIKSGISSLLLVLSLPLSMIGKNDLYM